MENNIDNFYSTFTDEELIRTYQQLISDKNRIEWSLYYLGVEMEERKKRLQEHNNTSSIQIPPSGGFAGASHFQKGVDEIVKKELKNN